MNYRRLTLEELESLRPDFIKFLATNGIDGQQWSALLSTQREEADRYIELFSEVVWLRILGNVRYLDEVTHDYIKLYRCDEDKIYAIILYAAEGHEIDFATKEAVLAEMSSHPDRFSIARAQKAYAPDRVSEIFKMIDKDHAHVVDGHVFEQLWQTISQASPQ
jgi:hypothetical protein